MQKNRKLDNDSAEVIRNDNSTLRRKGRRLERPQSFSFRDRRGIRTTDISDQQVEEGRKTKPRNPEQDYQDMSEKPYRGSNGNKPRQPNVVGKRYGLLSTQCIFDELMQELSREVATETFQKSKRDFVDAYLAEVAVRRCRSDIISEVVQLLLPGLVEEALREKAVDDVIEVDLLPEVIAAEARAVALSELVEQSALTAAQQFTQVRHYASNRLLDGYLLEHLVKLVASGGRCFTERELSGRLLDSWMLDVLSHRLLHVMHFRNLTVENVPLRTFHRRVFTDIALDVILSELTESLDEDMEQLLEYERLMEEDTG